MSAAVQPLVAAALVAFLVGLVIGVFIGDTGYLARRRGAVPPLDADTLEEVFDDDE